MGIDMKRVLTGFIVVAIAHGAFAQSTMIKAPPGLKLPPEMRRTEQQAAQEMAAKNVVVPETIPEISPDSPKGTDKRWNPKVHTEQGATNIAGASSQADQAAKIVKTATVQSQTQHGSPSWQILLGIAGFGLLGVAGFRRWAERTIPGPLKRRQVSTDFFETSFKQSNLK